MYEQKYLKYRAKYLNLKNELYFGGGLEDMPSQIITQILNKTTCKNVIKTAETNESVANKINFSDLTNNIVVNQNINININIRQNIACRRITDVARRNQCNEYYNKCYIKELFDKYCNIRYQGQILVAPVAPATYDVNTLNEILLRTIPNNIEDPDKVEDQENLIRFGANIDRIGNRAFQNNQLTDIRIPSTIRIISHYAFLSNQLDRLFIPDTVRDIGQDAFENNRLREITLPRRFEHIRRRMFGYHIEDNIFTYTD